MNKMLDGPFCWAIWNEDEDEDTLGVISSNWLVTGSHILWPPNNYLQVKHAFHGRREPDQSWKKFKLVKVKVFGTYEFCNDLCNTQVGWFSTANESVSPIKNKIIKKK
nr:uncharacterized protein LOC124816624 [Hydra vulgaris]